MATLEQQQLPQVAPPGWYEGADWVGERYWNGVQWTDEYRQAPPAAAEEPVEPEKVPRWLARWYEEREQAQELRAIPAGAEPEPEAWAAALDDPDWDAHREAAVALCRIGDRRGLALVDDVQGTDPALSGVRVDATIALVRVMLEPGECILESGLDINAGLALQAFLEHLDPAVRSAASWGLGRIPQVGAPPRDAVPMFHLMRWVAARQGEAMRAGRLHLPDETAQQVLHVAEKIAAETGAPAADPGGAEQAEREQLLAQAGLHPSAVPCSSCGRALWQHPTGPLGPSLLGNVCLSCGQVFCDLCIQVGGPTPCPRCGRPTEPAGQFELARVGMALGP